MSRICIAVLQVRKGRLQELREAAAAYAEDHGFGVHSSLSYEEPFLAHYDETVEILSFSDHMEHENCEMLLLPDNCSVNGFRSGVPFRVRMQWLAELLGSLKVYVEVLDVFIGDSGAHYEDFDLLCVKFSEFAQRVEQEHGERDFPLLHIRFSKPKKKGNKYETC